MAGAQGVQQQQQLAQREQRVLQLLRWHVTREALALVDALVCMLVYVRITTWFGCAWPHPLGHCASELTCH